ncbi:hypothetical protein ACVT81_001372 [Yersinia enterocolitica]|uniref:hypothetical protein n=1 Tax=Yersinia enterocolitica TaxID=630 RepID=UPI0027E7A2EB|nr:hypothetical protein [Yersinia enterocolitica]EKN4837320.1 hypothetical protein [Yersinia enterocolitica]EKN5088952.1 hypothetical protein [Yersinia enterocolitica]EKN6271727.1 hypothetical protein [Yersinia enterocolitica]EKN6368331.1 hypothetical protein [Yersinia enterocolitica]
MLSERPEPTTKEECALDARIYADEIRRHPRLMVLAEFRIKAVKSNAPDWFLRYVDGDIRYAMFRLEQLDGWSRGCDPRDFAADTMRTFKVCADMLRAYINPSSTLWNGDNSKAAEWLQSLITPRVENEPSK